MKAAVIVFPASNCDREAADAVERATGRKPAMVWHRDTDLPDVDLIVVPGGFSYGDYLRVGAMRSDEHTSELQSLMRISYAVFCLKKKTTIHSNYTSTTQHN